MDSMAPMLDLTAPTVSGQPLGEIISGQEIYNDEVIRTPADPVKPDSGLWVLRGNLAPLGAIVKPSAGTPELLHHRGRAVVFESIEDFKARIDDPDLPVDKDSILVLKGCGPKGYPGMPEVGNMPLPAKLLEQGVRDMVRLSDARMSGTAFGTVILHIAPEASAGGPLAIVQNGDEILFDGANRRLELLIDDAEMARRLAAWETQTKPVLATRGYARLYIEHVLQADQGCDLDFLVGGSGSVVTRESH
jgi:dehydratase ilvD1